MKNNKRPVSDKDMDKMARASISVPDAALRREIVQKLSIKRRMAGILGDITLGGARPLAPDTNLSARVFDDGGIISLDLHRKTVDDAWELIGALFRQNAGRRVRVISGASGILKIKFVEWITNGALSDMITEWSAINTGMFEIKLRKEKV